MPSTLSFKTYSAKPGDGDPKWVLIDAKGKVLGRLASEVANILRGKNKPCYTPHIDVGDHVVIVNAEKVAVTGRKSQDKRYFRHSQYPGGVKIEMYSDLQRKFPERIIEKAVKGMLPKNNLGRAMFRKLKVYAGEKHPHEAQKVEKIDI